MNYDELIEGDLIRALITDEGLEKTRREHCFIIFGPQKVKNPSKKRHVVCIPACSFSSKFPKCGSEIYVELNTQIVPFELFNEHKENTILRLGRPKCIERYQFIKYQTNLKQYPEFWKEICEKVYSAFQEDLGTFSGVCDCQCLINNEIEAGYCEQDEPALIEELCPFPCDPKKICSCCGYEFDQFDTNFTVCPECNDNVYVIIIDQFGFQQIIYNPAGQCI